MQATLSAKKRADRRNQVLGCRSSLLCECVCAWHLLRVGISGAKGCKLSHGLPALLAVRSVADLELADVS